MGSKWYDLDLRNIAKVSPNKKDQNSLFGFLKNFSSRKKFSSTYAIVSFLFCFFFSRPFMKILNFSKTVHTFFYKILQSFYTQRGPCVRRGIKIVWVGCEKHSQNQPKNGQKTAIFDFFPFFQKDSYDSNEIFYSHSTPY